MAFDLIPSLNISSEELESNCEYLPCHLEARKYLTIRTNEACAEIRAKLAEQITVYTGEKARLLGEQCNYQPPKRKEKSYDKAPYFSDDHPL